MINMSRLTTLLTGIGLGDTEVKVFDHLYHNGERSASTISTTLSLNRATCYHALHTLGERGFVVSETKNGTKYFSITEGDILLQYFEYEKEKLEHHKSDFKDYLQTHKPKVAKGEESTMLYSGEEGIRVALEKAFKCTSKKWCVIAPKNNFFTGSTEDFATYYLERRKKYKIHARSLWETPKTGSPSVKKIINEERSPRYLSKNAPSFTSMVILFDSSALFISSYQERSAILVNSESVASLLKMQFEELYKIATVPTVREK